MRRRYHIHLPGVVYVALTILVGVAAANRPNNLLVWAFGAMLAGVLISGMVSGGMLMGVRATRLDPRRGTVGTPLIVRYAVSNRGRLWPAFNLHIEERPSSGRGKDGIAPWQTSMRSATGWVLHVGPHDMVHAEVVFFPQRRGRIAFDQFRVWTTFPFGFLRKSVQFGQRAETLIHPRVLQLRDDLIGSLVSGGMGGMRMSSAPGAGEDYFGVREYRPGDSVRQIAWKRVASGRGLVSIERSQTSPPRLRVVVNMRTPTDRLRVTSDVSGAARALEEDAIALAASIIARAETEGYEVGLTVLGLPSQRSPIRRGHWHTEKLMAALAALDLDAARREDATLGESDRDRATIVVVHPDRALPQVAPVGAWHLVATQLESLLAPEPKDRETEAAAPAEALK